MILRNTSIIKVVEGGLTGLLICARRKLGLSHREINGVIAKLLPYQKNIKRLTKTSELKSYFSNRIEIILSGFVGGSPLLILSTNSMPLTTRPHTVYFPSKKRASFKTIKN